MKKPLLDQYKADLQYDSDFVQLVYNFSHNHIKLTRKAYYEMLNAMRVKSEYRRRKINERFEELKALGNVSVCFQRIGSDNAQGT